MPEREEAQQGHELVPRVSVATDDLEEFDVVELEDRLEFSAIADEQIAGGGPVDGGRRDLLRHAAHDLGDGFEVGGGGQKPSLLSRLRTNL